MHTFFFFYQLPPSSLRPSHGPYVSHLNLFLRSFLDPSKNPPKRNFLSQLSAGITRLWGLVLGCIAISPGILSLCPGDGTWMSHFNSWGSVSSPVSRENKTEWLWNSAPRRPYTCKCFRPWLRAGGSPPPPSHSHLLNVGFPSILTERRSTALKGIGVS